jgi:uncharacterized protein
MVIVDTGFWLALANLNDSYHTQAIAVLANLNEPLITTWAVVTETCYLLLTRMGNHAQISFINNRTYAKLWKNEPRRTRRTRWR